MPTNDSPDSDAVVVYTALNLPTAEMIRQYLAGEGFTPGLRSRGLSAFIGVDNVDILVPAEQEAGARLALAAFLEGMPDDDWTDGQ